MKAPSIGDWKIPVPLEQVAALQQAAVEYVHRVTELSLDGSEESLAFVDHYIEQTCHKNGPPLAPAVLQLVTAALGVYLGELCIAHFGGRWLGLSEKSAEAARETAAVASWRVELTAAPLLIDPISMVAAALISRAQTAEEVEVFALLPGHTQLLEPLHAALSRMAPVAAEYYYSLTGRFETLRYIVDLLVEMSQPSEDKGEDEETSTTH